MIVELKEKEKFRDDLVETYISGSVFSGAIRNAHQFSERKKIPIEYGFYNQLRIEGMKTLGFEVLEDLKRVPDWYVQAVGSGVGLFAFNKACRELYGKSPQLVGVQPKGCAPMVNAFFGKEKPEIKNIDTHVIGISNPELYVSYSHLKRIKAVFKDAYEGGKGNEKKEISRLIKMYQEEGIENPGLEATVALSGLEKMVKEKKIKRNDLVVLCCSGKLREDLS